MLERRSSAMWREVMSTEGVAAIFESKYDVMGPQEDESNCAEVVV